MALSKGPDSARVMVRSCLDNVASMLQTLLAALRNGAWEHNSTSSWGHVICGENCQEVLAWLHLRVYGGP